MMDLAFVRSWYSTPCLIRVPPQVPPNLAAIHLRKVRSLPGPGELISIAGYDGVLFVSHPAHMQKHLHIKISLLPGLCRAADYPHAETLGSTFTWRF